MEFLFDYVSFLLKVATVAAAIIVIVTVIAASSMKRQHKDTFGHLEIRHVNDVFEQMKSILEQAGQTPEERKKKAKEDKRKKKDKKGESQSSEDGQEAEAEGESADTDDADDAERKRNLYVMNFEGDVEASRTNTLRLEVSAVLTNIQENDEVLVRVESVGGLVHSYGYAASQLMRLRKAGVHLTVAVDKVAASGGYMLAVVADKIIAAPFAVVGSIGVAAELPNLNRLLKKHDVDYEIFTAGKYKRTLSVLGENTDEARQKFTEEIEDVHGLFKEFVSENRSQVDLEVVSTGETWYGERAMKINLVDELQTSDEYIMNACKDANVYEVSWSVPKKSFSATISESLETVVAAWKRITGRFS